MGIIIAIAVIFFWFIFGYFACRMEGLATSLNGFEIVLNFLFGPINWLIATLVYDNFIMAHFLDKFAPVRYLQNKWSGREKSLVDVFFRL